MLTSSPLLVLVVVVVVVVVVGGDQLVQLTEPHSLTRVRLALPEIGENSVRAVEVEVKQNKINTMKDSSVFMTAVYSDHLHSWGLNTAAQNISTKYLCSRDQTQVKSGGYMLYLTGT